MRKHLLTLVALLVSVTVGFGQDHFVPVWSGNGLSQMNIYVTKATINDVFISVGDEIGVFDGDNCVGYAIRPISITGFIEVRVSMDDPLTTGVIDGYTPGNPITFRIWDQSAGVELMPQVNVTSGSSTFVEGGTAMVELTYVQNRVPVANAGTDLVIAEGASFTVSGTASYDPEGLTLSYSWQSDMAVDETQLTLPSFTVTAPEVDANTTYYFRLVVNDGAIDSNPDTVRVVVRNENKVPQITEQLTALSTNEDEPLSISLSAVAVIDPDPNQTLTLRVLAGNGYTLSDNTIVPVANYCGTLAVPVVVSDGIASSNVFVLDVSVIPVNDIPRFASKPVLYALEGKTYTYNIKVVDADLGCTDNPVPDALTITAELPTWLTLLTEGQNNGEAIVGGIPTTANVGEHSITISVTDGVINELITQTYTLVVRSVGVAPELLTTALGSATVNAAYTQSLEFYDVDSDSVIVRLNNQPSWISLEGAVNGAARLKVVEQTATVNLLGTPPALALGTVGLNVLFTDKANLRSKIFPLSVFAINTPPVAMEANLTTNEDEPVLVVLRGTDAQTPSGLTFAITSNPKHGSLEQIAPRLFIYHPTSNFFGLDSLTFTVTEPGSNSLSASAKVYFAIQPVNDEPTITAPERRFVTAQGAPVTIEGIEMTDAIDVNLASSLALNTVLGPFHGTFDSETRAYTPNEFFSGRDVLFLVATETQAEGLSSEPLMIKLVVTPVNHTPWAGVAPVITFEDTPVRFMPVAYDREDRALDLTVILTSEPKNGTLQTSALNFRYTPNAEFSGKDSVMFKLMDSNGELTTEYKVVINVVAVNDYPAAQSSEVKAFGSKTVPLDFSTLVSDIDNSASELSVEFLLLNQAEQGTGLFPSYITEGGNNLSYIYNAQHNFPNDVVFYRVFDGLNTSSPAMLSISGLPVTKSLTSTKATVDTLIARGDYYDINWGDTLNVIFTVLLSDASSATPPVLEITNIDALSGTLGTPKVVSFAQYNPLVVFTAEYIAPYKSQTKARGNDTEMMLDKVGFKSRKGTKKGSDILNQLKATGDESNVDTIYIGGLNRKVPVTIAPIANQVVAENQSVDITIYYSDPDTPASSIVWNAGTVVAGVQTVFSPVTNGQQKLTVTPPASFFGDLILSVSATDDTLTVRKEFNINVTQVNQAPVINSVNSIHFMKNAARMVLLGINDRETAADNLLVTVTATPETAMQQYIYNDGDVTIIPAAEQVTDFAVTVSVSDGEHTTTHQFNMLYKATNSLPMLETINSIRILEDATAQVTFSPYDADVEDELAVTVESSNGTLVAESSISVTPATGVSGTSRGLTITPVANQSGLCDITVFANDGFKSTAQQFTLEVLPVNDAPVLDAIDAQAMDNNQELNIALGVADIDSYVFTFDAESTNANLAFEVNDNMLTVSVLNSYYGETSFSVSVADDSLATATQTVQLTVNNASTVPTVGGLNLDVYPNPTSSELFVNLGDRVVGTATISMYSVNGQKLWSRTLTSSSAQLQRFNIKAMPAGIYVVELLSGGKVYRSKVMKN
ncbi:MAG: tandem-95 repeat protein [Bacteroidales bacterium]|nr:tandem-95 repeat protein [Bacteroidales bacterium]MBN2747950.1 tandem-95 repeat protein [Bacteroidales bacterium]